MIVRLNENRFSKLFLTESANSKRAHKQTREILATVLNRTVDDEMVIASEQAFEKELFGEGLRTDWFITLEPYAAKWVYLQNYPLPSVKTAIKYIAAKASSVQDRNAFMQQVRSIDEFNDLWLFIEKCKKEDRQFARDNRVERPVLNQNYYPPIGPLTFNESAKYGNKSGGNGVSCKICYTQGSNTWNNYSKNGENNLYILLRKDWEKWNNVNGQIRHDGSEANNGLGEPYNRLNGYDDYGLSMIFVWLTPNGDISVSNTRWNHGGNFISLDVDQAFKPEAIERLMGGTFKDIFNVDNIYDSLDSVEEKLANGEDPKDIFDKIVDCVRHTDNYDLYSVMIGTKYNLLKIDTSNTRSLVFSDYWANDICILNEFGDLCCKFGDANYVYTIENNLVSFNKFVNVLQERIENGVNLSDLFQRVTEFSEQYKAVSFNNDIVSCCNLITNDGRFITNKWQDKGNTSYYDALHYVFLGNKVNIFKEDGSLLFNIPYDEWPNNLTYSHSNKVFCFEISNKGKMLFKDDLTPLTDEWYQQISGLDNDEGFAIAKIFGGYYVYINLYNGNVLGEGMNIIDCQYFGNVIKGAGYVTVKVHENDYTFVRYCFLTKNNELFSYDDYVKHLKGTSFLELANGKKVEDVFSNYVVIGENVFVNLRNNEWNMLNSERNDFAFPFNLEQPKRISDFALIKTQYGKNDYDYKYNVIYPNGEMAINTSIDDWCDTIENIYNAEDCLTLYFNKNGRCYLNFLTRNGLAFKDEIDKWVNSFRNTAYEGRFLHVEKFQNGYKFNILDLDTGDLLWKKPLKHWFDYLDSMSGRELSEVRIGDKRNVYSYYKGLLWKKPLSEWFDGITGWYNDDNAIKVIKDNHVNILKENGKLLFKHWFDSITYHRSDDVYTLRLNGKVNIFNRGNGKLLFNGILEEWPDSIYDIDSMGGVYMFSINGKYNIITPSRKLLWNRPYEEWFDGITTEQNGYFVVRKDGKGNLLSKNGKLVFDVWHDYVGPPINGLCVVGEGEKTKYNFLNKKGEPISKIWFDGIFKTFNELGFAEICKNRRYNLINKKGKLLIDLPNKYWPKDLINTIIRDGNVYLETKINYETCFITRNGKYSKSPVAYCKTDLTSIGNEKRRLRRRSV